MRNISGYRTKSVTKRKSSSPSAMGPKKVARPARIPINMSASFRDRLVLDIGRGFGFIGLRGLHILDHAQLFKLPAYDQGSLRLGRTILALREIVQCAEFGLPQ